MEPITIIFGVAVIFVAAYAADQYTWKEKYAGQVMQNKQHCERAVKEAESLRAQILSISSARSNWPETQALRQELKEAIELRAHLEEQLAKANSELVGFHLATKRRSPVFYDHAPLNQGRKPAEVIKIELDDDFKELKAAVDSLGSVQVLKTELDRAHKREAIYMKRLLVSNAAILAATKKA